MAKKTEDKKAVEKKTKAKTKKEEAAVMDDVMIATDFLVTSKAAVRNLAVAITETATPSVKKVLRTELDTAIDTHDKIAQYMIKNEMYHAYNIDEQIEHDLKKADTALKLAKKSE